MALEEGRRLLYSGQAFLAIPASLQVTAMIHSKKNEFLKTDTRRKWTIILFSLLSQAVRYLTELGSTEVGGAEGAVDIAPAYLILSEAAIRKSP